MSRSESATSSGVVERSSFAHLNVDPTVLERHIAHPTVSALLEKMRGKLVAFMRAHELSIRQSYARQGPRLAQQIGRHAHARQFKRMRRLLSKQRTWVGRLKRELERQPDLLSSAAREKKRMGRRSALEAIIGHMKLDGLLARCHLKGTHGDAAHAILCRIGHNLRQMRTWWLRRLFALWIGRLRHQTLAQRQLIPAKAG